MWWSVTALTTVGYGDLYPITFAGKFLGSVVAFIGVGLFALPAGIISSGFVEVLEIQRQEDTDILAETIDNELSEIDTLRTEVQSLRDEVKALRMVVESDRAEAREVRAEQRALLSAVGELNRFLGEGAQRMNEQN